MSDSEKQRVLQYAELVFKSQRQTLSDEELREMNAIEQELGKSREEILELAQKKLFPENQ